MSDLSGFLKSLVVKDRSNQLLELKLRASGVNSPNSTPFFADNRPDFRQ